MANISASARLFETRSLPLSLAVTLTALPSMSLLPVAPFLSRRALREGGFSPPHRARFCYFPRFHAEAEVEYRCGSAQGDLT